MSVGMSIDERIDTRSLLNLGKRVRMDRIMDRKTGRTVIIPMDHGASGPIKGLDNMPEIIDKVAIGGANAIILHKGIVKYSWRGPKGSGRDVGLGLHLSVGNNRGPNENYKVSLATVEDALAYAADFVSLHVNVGSESEPEQMKHFGIVDSKCERWGMPLLAMMYPRGPKVKDPYGVEEVKFAARLGAEAGANIVKTNYTGSIESFKEVVKGCPAPVVMAGGPKTKTEDEFLNQVYGCIQAGGKGFQHKDPTYMTRVLCGIVHKDMEVEEAKTYAKNIENFKN
jgi:fructose-bisphosphate aldolase/2-amino-3,7-dideoxy-D-threo-hept-6-ulosonate synthase